MKKKKEFKDKKKKKQLFWVPMTDIKVCRFKFMISRWQEQMGITPSSVVLKVFWRAPVIIST